MCAEFLVLTRVKCPGGLHKVHSEGERARKLKVWLLTFKAAIKTSEKLRFPRLERLQVHRCSMVTHQHNRQIYLLFGWRQLNVVEGALMIRDATHRLRLMSYPVTL
jgi:hypothetical protein